MRKLRPVALGIACTTVSILHPLPVRSQSAPGVADYRISAEQTQVVILVYRAGILARLGHHHVVSTTDIEGTVSLDTREGHASFVVRVPVDTLEVDNAELRQLEDEAFATEPSEADIEGTRENMLGRELLDAAQHPTLTVRGTADGTTSAVVTFEVKTHRTERTVPLQVRVTEESIRITGALELTHEELGLTRFRALGGALRVAEAMDVRFTITALRDTEAR